MTFIIAYDWPHVTMPGEDNNSTQGKYENYFLRSFCAFIIICITFVHFEPSWVVLDDIRFYHLVEGVGRFAIPAFFMVSGYFLFSKDGHSERRLGKKLLHIIYLIIFIKVLYFIIDLIWLGCGIEHWHDGVVDWDYVLSDTITAEWNTMPVWFAYCLALVYAFHWILYKKNLSFKYAMYIGLAFVIVDMLLCEVLLFFGVTSIFGLSTVGLGEITYPFIGMLFFSLGYYIHRYKDEIDSKFSNESLILLFIAGFLLSVFEFMFLYTYYRNGVGSANLTFGSLFLAFSLFLGSFRLKENQLRSRSMEFMGRELLPWMYGLYMASILVTRTFIMPAIPIDDQAILDLIGLVCSIALDIGISYLWWTFLKMIVTSRKKAVKQ